MSKQAKEKLPTLVDTTATITIGASVLITSLYLRASKSKSEGEKLALKKAASTVRSCNEQFTDLLKDSEFLKPSTNTIIGQNYTTVAKIKEKILGCPEIQFVCDKQQKNAITKSYDDLLQAIKQEVW